MLMRLAAIALALALPAARVAAEDPVFKQGSLKATPKAAQRPGTIVKWKAVVVRENIPVYKSFTGDDKLAGAAPKFGELLYVADSNDLKGPSPRLLVGRFGPDGDTFESWVGWVDAAYVLDSDRPLEVQQARELAAARVPGSHPEAKKVKDQFPDAARENYKNVTLKAVTHPEKGKAAFLRPVSAKEYPEAVKEAKKAKALQPFAFFYVYKIAVEADHVYCLLGPRSRLTLSAGQVGDKLKEQVAGWVLLDSLILWTTREAFEYNLQKPALTARRSKKKPIQLYKKKEDLQDWAAWATGGAAGEPPVKPVWEEELNPKKADAYMQKSWPANWMRYPILASYPLGGQGPEGMKGYQICVLGSADGGLAPAVSVEEMKKKLSAAVAQLRYFEIVIVLDATGSMQRVIDPLKEAMVKLVQALKSEAGRSTDDLEKVQLRVAVMLYKDFDDEDSNFLTDTNGEFFDVMSDDGMSKFKEYLEGIQTDGGGDNLEEPFEGIDAAVKKFLAAKGSKHAPGAARLIVTVGDAGNHAKEGRDKTRLDTEAVKKLLSPVGKDTVSGQERKVAKITLHSLLTPLNAGHLDTPSAKIWQRQMGALAEVSGGKNFVVDFTFKEDESDEAAEARKAAIAKMREAMVKSIEARRELMRKELEAIRGEVGGSGGGTVRGAALTVAKDRLSELITDKKELDDIMKGLSKAFFSTVHTVEAIPGEVGGRARQRLCILLTRKELREVLVSTERIADGLDALLSEGGLSGDKVATKIKTLMIETMLYAFGETPTAAKVLKLVGLPLSQVQKQINRLPILFGLLKEQPKTEAELRRLVERLKERASKLSEILNNTSDDKNRFFPAGVATGEMHVWVYEEELP